MSISIHLRIKIAEFDPVKDGKTVKQFCKNIGVSRQTYANIKRRIAEHGDAGIPPDSTAPIFNNFNNATAFSYPELSTTIDFQDGMPSDYFTVVRIFKDGKEVFLAPTDYPGFTFGRDGRLQLRVGNEPLDLKVDISDAETVELTFQGYYNNGSTADIRGLMFENPQVK